MCLERDIVFLCELCKALHELHRAAHSKSRSDDWPNQQITFVCSRFFHLFLDVLDNVFCCSNGLLGLLDVVLRSIHVHINLPDECPLPLLNAFIGQQLRGFGMNCSEVGAVCCSMLKLSLNHLRIDLAGEFDIVEFCFNRKRILLEPVQQFHIATVSHERVLGGVEVGVYEAGYDKLLGGELDSFNMMAGERVFLQEVLTGILLQVEYRACESTEAEIGFVESLKLPL